MESLHDSDRQKNCVIDYILFWAKLDKVPAQMIVIEKLKVLNNVVITMNKKPFIIPFVPCESEWTNEYMANEYICKEALGTLFGLGPHALKSLVRHAKYHTLPIHGLTGRVDSKSVQFQDNILPPLRHFFKNEIVPLAGARPTRYTRDAVTQTVIERDAKDILELDPGVSKRGLYKEYAYFHGWKIQTTAKGNVIKTSHYAVTDEEYQQQVQICSWGSFCNYWKKNHSNMIVRKPSNDICATCYKYHMWQKGGGMFCHEIDGQDDDDLEYEDNYNHGDDWDTEELVINSDVNDDDNNNNMDMDEDANGYTASERAYMEAISILEDDVDMVEDEQQQQHQQEEDKEKDKRYYLREEQALGNVVVINKLRLHINEARSMRQEARIAVGQAKEDTHNKVPVEQMHIVTIVDFYQNVQLLPTKRTSLERHTSLFH